MSGWPTAAFTSSATRSCVKPSPSREWQPTGWPCPDVVHLAADNNHYAAFTLKELLVILTVGCSLLCVLVVELSKARQRTRGICCNCNLKQVGLAFKLWAGDHQEKFPMQVSVTNGGTMEMVDSGKTFMHFAAISNELSTPKVLVCPADRTRKRAADFCADLDNAKISYFVGVDAN